MNILFFVMSFLLIFSFCSLSLLKDQGAFTEEKHQFCQHLKGRQKLFNQWSRYQYSLKKKKTPAVLSKETGSSSRILRKTHSKLSKWNLAPLFLEGSEQKAIIKKTALLLQELYGHTEFWQEGLAEALIEAFMAKKGDCNVLSDICDLFPENPDLQKSFYKMLKGSSLYDLEKKKGYPPLTQFFLLDVEAPEVLYFSYASSPALCAFLGKDLGKEVLAIEEEKSQSQEEGIVSFAKEDLLLLASNKGKNQEITPLLPLLSFAKKKVLLEKLIEKEGKGPSMEQPLPSR